MSGTTAPWLEEKPPAQPPNSRLLARGAGSPASPPSPALTRTFHVVFCSGEAVLRVAAFFLPPELLSKKARKSPVCSELQPREGREKDARAGVNAELTNGDEAAGAGFPSRSGCSAPAGGSDLGRAAAAARQGPDEAAACPVPLVRPQGRKGAENRYTVRNLGRVCYREPCASVGRVRTERCKGSKN